MPFISISERRAPLVVACCAVALTCSLALIYWTMTHRGSKVGARARQLHQMVGDVTAQETIKLVGKKGRVVVVSMDTSQSKARPAEMELEHFLKTLKNLSTLTVVTTQLVTPESSVTRSESGLSAETFIGMVQQHPDVDVLVSFAGAPVLSAEQIQALPAKIPKVIAVLALTFQSRLKPLFEQNIIQVAITPRFDGPPAGTKPPETVREWFDYSFKVLTTETEAMLANGEKDGAELLRQ